MLSSKTLRNMQLIQIIGNWLAVAPVIMRYEGPGSSPKYDFVYNGKLWNSFTISAIVVRVIMILIGLFLIAQSQIMSPTEKAFVLLLILLSAVPAGLQILDLFQAEDVCALWNDFFQLNQHLCKK